jgi:hypothetical protein
MKQTTRVFLTQMISSFISAILYMIPLVSILVRILINLTNDKDKSIGMAIVFGAILSLFFSVKYPLRIETSILIICACVLFYLAYLVIRPYNPNIPDTDEPIRD